jgi:hypothetical protein
MVTRGISADPVPVFDAETIVGRLSQTYRYRLNGKMTILCHTSLPKLFHI